jgi:hypothetical protein
LLDAAHALSRHGNGVAKPSRLHQGLDRRSRIDPALEERRSDAPGQAPPEAVETGVVEGKVAEAPHPVDRPFLPNARSKKCEGSDKMPWKRRSGDHKLRRSSYRMKRWRINFGAL